MKTTIEPKTFSTKGLTDVEINFLNEVEALYFKGNKINLDMLKEAFANAGYQKGCPEAKECLDAWHYWESIPHPYDRQSALNPIELSEVLTVVPQTPDNKDKVFYVSVRNGGGFYAIPNMDYFNSDRFKIDLLYPFNSMNFYFTLNDFGGLWLNYQHIIGSRYICDTIK